MIDKCCFVNRSLAMMEKKQDNMEATVESARNIVEQVNTLLTSTANPSDTTSLSIRLSMVKVSILNF